MNTVNYFLIVIEWVFLQPREEKLFSARRNFTASCGRKFLPFILTLQRYDNLFAV